MSGDEDYDVTVDEPQPSPMVFLHKDEWWVGVPSSPKSLGWDAYYMHYKQNNVDEGIYVIGGDMPEEYWMNMICHEIDHWAQGLYLKEHVKWRIQETYHNSIKANKVPFTEKVNRFPSLGWSLLMEQEGYKKYFK